MLAQSNSKTRLECHLADTIPLHECRYCRLATTHAGNAAFHRTKNVSCHPSLRGGRESVSVSQGLVPTNGEPLGAGVGNKPTQCLNTMIESRGWRMCPLRGRADVAMSQGRARQTRRAAVPSSMRDSRRRSGNGLLALSGLALHPLEEHLLCHRFEHHVDLGFCQKLTAIGGCGAARTK